MEIVQCREKPKPWAEGVRRAIAWHAADATRQTIDDTSNTLWDRILSEYLKAFPKE